MVPSRWMYTKQSHNFATIAAATQCGTINSNSSRGLPQPDYRAVLDAVQVEEITTNAGVRKEFEAFAKMIFSALVGSNTSVSFFVENCAEMEKRIRERRMGATESNKKDTLDNSLLSGSSTHAAEDDAERDEEDGDEASLRRRFFHQQLFFSLDYNVDFTRALFPIPLSSAANQQLPPPHKHTPTSHRDAAPNATPLSSHSGEEYREKFLEASKDKKRLEHEVKRLKKENEALTKLCNERMTEMQRPVRRPAVQDWLEAETRKLKRELVDAQQRVRQLESLTDSLRREVKAAAATGGPASRSPLRRPSPSRLVGPATQPQSVRQRRFDTPPHSRAVPSAPRDSSRQSSRASPPPRSPRPAWGQRATGHKPLTPQFVDSLTSHDPKHTV